MIEVNFNIVLYKIHTYVVHTKYLKSHNLDILHHTYIYTVYK